MQSSNAWSSHRNWAITPSAPKLTAAGASVPLFEHDDQARAYGPPLLLPNSLPAHAISDGWAVEPRCSTYLRDFSVSSDIKSRGATSFAMPTQGTWPSEGLFLAQPGHSTSLPIVAASCATGATEQSLRECWHDTHEGQFAREDRHSSPRSAQSVRIFGVTKAHLAEAAAKRLTARCDEHSAVPFSAMASGLVVALADELNAICRSRAPDHGLYDHSYDAPDEILELLMSERTSTPRRQHFHSLSFPDNTPWSSPDQACGLSLADHRNLLTVLSHFAAQVIGQTLISSNTLFLALFYVLRLPRLLSDNGDAFVSEYHRIFNGPPSSAPFKLLVLGLMIANKHLDDNTFLNKTWNEVTGIPLSELNGMERFFLRICNYSISPTLAEWNGHIRQLRSFATRRLHIASLLVDAKSFDSPPHGSFDRILHHLNISADTFQKMLTSLHEQPTTPERINQSPGVTVHLLHSKHKEACWDQRRDPSWMSTASLRAQAVANDYMRHFPMSHIIAA